VIRQLVDHPRRRLLPRGRDDRGFSLVEVMVALGIIVGVTATVTLFFLRSVAATSVSAQRQTAIMLAGQAIDSARAVPTIKLTQGRTEEAVDTQWGTLGTVSVTDTEKTWDSAATSTSVPVLPLASTKTVANEPYTIKTFIGACYRPTGATSGCSATEVSGSVPLYRVTVAVGWSPGRGQRCPSNPAGLCEYVVSTLVDPAVSPVFNNSDN
jgi:prepilin-type N-terminal cleavage/methylation domain-containing protein